MTLGRLIYLIYFKPIAVIRQSIREGGPVRQFITLQGRLAMRQAAVQLSPTDKTCGSPEQSYEIHVLTGRKFWYQTVFCIRSLIGHAAPLHIRPVFYDDGTLGAYRAILARIFPDHRFVSKAEAKQNLDAHLPLHRFPCLRERWNNYANIRKLTDPHLAGSGGKLVLDSDMLFFRKPDFLLQWLSSPARPLHMVDFKESYGYDRETMEKLAGAPLPRKLNVGITGLASERIDWERLEFWICALQNRYGTHYYLEQALIAMMAAGRECAVAPAHDYITWPGREEAVMPKAVAHHYVAGSKHDYFRLGWRAALRAMHL
jgi:hypothetical protein